jgi:PEP-CTERM motif-containing protein
MRLFKRAFLTLGVLALAATTASALPVVGELNITGSVGVSATVIDWLPSGTGVGTFSVDPFTQLGDFVPLAGTAGASRDLTSATDPVGVAFNPGPVFTVPAFLTFAADPTILFHLQYIFPGVFTSADCFAAPAAGQTCTPVVPGGSPFNLSNTTATSSTATFQVKGVIQHGTDFSDFVGTYSTQFVSLNYQQVLSTILSGGTVNATYSANFIASVVPEPSTIWLMVGSIGALGLLRRKRLNG